MVLRIVIPIKQVPETSNVKMDEKTGTMIREGVESIINPLDLYAIETGIQLKEKYGGEITVITMGPPSAEKALREALAMGCDEAILVSGKEFSGSDTWATSYALSEAVRKIERIDIILAGERATDGDTGQVGPGLASFLNLPLSTYTSRIVELNEGRIVVERLVEEGYEMLRLPLPAVLTVVKEISDPRLPTLRGKKAARAKNIPVWDAGVIGIEATRIGLKGSPTRVVKIESPKVARKGVLLKAQDEDSLQEAVEQLVEFLQKKELLA
ncbi:MAG: electron transfer flavoprotein subunit beta/FixA family protein [Peptococcaceae bacterium]|nr:electron transfer flavoprotein subunit beta/FixA family protein [Peptococcaceae bacterium]